MREAARAAVVAVQSRLGSAGRGHLSMATGQAPGGELSVAAEGGLLAVVERERVEGERVTARRRRDNAREAGS